jgi:hypothetical protein
MWRKGGKHLNYPPARRTVQCFQFHLQVATWTHLVFSRKLPESNKHEKLSSTKIRQFLVVITLRLTHKIWCRNGQCCPQSVESLCWPVNDPTNSFTPNFKQTFSSQKFISRMYCPDGGGTHIFLNRIVKRIGRASLLVGVGQNKSHASTPPPSTHYQTFKLNA